MTREAAMTREAFIATNFQAGTLTVIEQANGIIAWRTA